MCYMKIREEISFIKESHFKEIKVEPEVSELKKEPQPMEPSKPMELIDSMEEEKKNDEPMTVP